MVSYFTNSPGDPACVSDDSLRPESMSSSEEGGNYRLATFYDGNRNILIEVSIDKAAETAVTFVNRVLPARSTALFLFSKEGWLVRKAIVGVESSWLSGEHYERVGNLVAEATLPRTDTSPYGHYIVTERPSNGWGDSSVFRAYEDKLGVIENAAYIPLNGPNRTFGVIRVLNRLDPSGRVASFSVNDILFLLTYAAQVATSISNIRRKLELDAFTELNLLLSQRDEEGPWPQPIYDRLTEILVRDWTDWVACVLRLSDHKGELIFKSMSVSPGVSKDKDRNPRKETEGFVGEVFESGEPLIVEDVSQRECDFKDFGWLSRNGIKGYGCFPLKLRGRTIGTLSIYCKYVYSFHDNKKKFIEGLAESVVAATDVFRLESTRRKIGEFIARLISHHDDYMSLLHEIVETGREATGAEVGYIALTSNKDNHLHPSNWTSGLEGRIPLVDIEGRGLTALVARTGKSVLCNDVHNDPEYRDVFIDLKGEMAHKVISEMVVPLVYESRVIGVINMESSLRGKFTADDKFVLETLAKQATLVFQRQKFYAMATRLADLKFPRTDRNSISSLIVSNVAAITDLGVVALYLVDSRNAQRFNLSVVESGATALTDLPAQIEIARAAVEGEWIVRELDGELVLAESVAESFRPFMRDRGLATLLAVALRADSSDATEEVPVHGIVFAFTSRKHKLFQAEFNLLKILAAASSLALAECDLVEKLEKATERAALTQRMISVAEIAAGVAHDSGNLLNIVTTGFNLIKSELKRSESFREDSSLQDAFQKIEKNLTKLTDYFARLKYSNRLSKPKFDLHDVNDILRDVVALLDFRIRKLKIRYKQELKSLPKILCDREQLFQVFTNIMINALDAMKERGALFVGTELYGKDFIRVRITDDGSGIDDGDRSKIFEPFFTTKEETGTGVGLTISQQIVQITHGGRIDFESRRGKGTTFYVMLPTLENR